METLRLHKTLAILNLVITATFILDTFLLQPVLIEETFYGYSSTETRNVGISSHWTNSIITKSGNTYREPRDTKSSLKYGDTFKVAKSYIFQRPIQLLYTQPNGTIKINCGGLNESYFGLLIAIYIVLVSVINLSKKYIFKNRKISERLIFSATALLFLLVFIFFY